MIILAEQEVIQEEEQKRTSIVVGWERKFLNSFLTSISEERFVLSMAKKQLTLKNILLKVE